MDTETKLFLVFACLIIGALGGWISSWVQVKVTHRHMQRLVHGMDPAGGRHRVGYVPPKKDETPREAPPGQSNVREFPQPPSRDHVTTPFLAGASSY